LGKRRGALITEKQRILIQDLVKTACTGGVSLQAACDIIGITARTLQRWKKSQTMIDGRSLVKRIPHNKLSEAERQKVLEVVNSSKYGHLPPSKIVPLLADEGQYIASEATMYKILKEKKLLRHRLPNRPPSQYKPKALTASAPNEIYSWDITYLSSQIKGIFFYLYLIMDVYSRKIVGFQVYEKESSGYASDVIEDACCRETVKPGEVILHSDNGTPMKGATMLATLQRLGVIPSFSRPSVSDDNPYSEALFKTLKYCPHYPLHPFAELQDARVWTEAFVDWYNHHHLHSGIKFVTPADRHAQLDQVILKQRHEVYVKAKMTNPNRWSKNTRNWEQINEVFLNPEKGKNINPRSRMVA
jgi:putative transposase